jgi:hypothetical protein
MIDSLILASNGAGAGWLTLLIPLAFLLVAVAAIVTVVWRP